MRPNPQKTADLVTFTEDILNGKLHFLCSERFRCSDFPICKVAAHGPKSMAIEQVLTLAEWSRYLPGTSKATHKTGVIMKSCFIKTIILGK